MYNYYEHSPEVEEIVKEARRFYSEFKGEGLYAEETVSEDDEYYVTYYKPVPVTFGFEIEQKPDDIEPKRIKRILEWHYDGSGPIETTLPMKFRIKKKGVAEKKYLLYPGREIHKFINLVQSTGSLWPWKGQYPSPGTDRVTGTSGTRWRGCGSHIHMRPRYDLEYIRQRLYEAWATAYNTLVAVSYTHLTLPTKA